jgi:hypothetical protein
MPAAVAGVIVTAVISYARSGETYAAAGSPYYGKAVQEAIAGLKNLGENASTTGARTARLTTSASRVKASPQGWLQLPSPGAKPPPKRPMQFHRFPTGNPRMTTTGV